MHKGPSFAMIDLYYPDSTEVATMLRIDPNISIYVQLADHLRSLIFSGTLKPGDKIPSIRDMAVELEVNPNTMRRVYQELITDGLVHANGTLGNFVTDDSDRIRALKRAHIEEKTKAYLETLEACDADRDLILSLLKGDKS